MRVLKQFFSHWQNWLGLLLVAAFVMMAVAAPWLSPLDAQTHGPFKVVGRPSEFQPQPPSPEAPLGTLSGQLSVYHLLIWGSWPALKFGLLVAGLAALIGVLVGTTGAYFGGFYNSLMMRITDSFLAFPVIAGVVLIQQVSISLYNAGIYFYTGDSLLIAFILFSWMPYARIMNAIVLRLKQMEYIQAARALGAGPLNLIFRHLIPNAIAPAVVMAARDVGGMVLLQATFTFIGMGGNSLWGMLLVRGRDWIIDPSGIMTYWWVFLPATLALVLFGIGWNLLGDGLNDLLNPRLR